MELSLNSGNNTVIVIIPNCELDVRGSEGFIRHLTQLLGAGRRDVLTKRILAKENKPFGICGC